MSNVFVPDVSNVFVPELQDTKSERPTLACDHPSQVLKLGTSPDFARCKGTRKDGKNCTMHVNKSTSEYCAFHASAALKSLSTDRMVG